MASNDDRRRGLPIQPRKAHGFTKKTKSLSPSSSHANHLNLRHLIIIIIIIITINYWWRLALINYYISLFARTLRSFISRSPISTSHLREHTHCRTHHGSLQPRLLPVIILYFNVFILLLYNNILFEQHDTSEIPHQHPQGEEDHVSEKDITPCLLSSQP